MTSSGTAAAAALVSERLPEAAGLGRALADLLDDPEAFTATLRDGLERLADAACSRELDRVAPGGSPALGVRVPLLRAVARQLRAPLAEGSPATALWLAQRLAQATEREVRMFALVALERSMRADPERSWQLLRRLARDADDWITVDSIAEAVAEGITAEPFRWAELEQLVFSSSRWERRLVGAAIATMARRTPAAGRRESRREPALMTIKSLLGDPDPSVQKSLAWGLRSWRQVDPEGVTRLLLEEADTAGRDRDGNRARVIRDALPGEPPAVVADVRAALAGVRRRPGAPSTSAAHGVAAAFTEIGDLADRAVGQQGARMGRRGAP